MTRKEIKEWGQHMADRLFHKREHTEELTINGWVGRDKPGGLRLWRTKPYKERNFEYGECWGLPCEMGAWIRLDSSLFPQVKWDDEEPTKATLTIKIEK